MIKLWTFLIFYDNIIIEVTKMNETTVKEHDSTCFETTFSFPNSDELNMYYCGKRIKTPNHSYGPEVRTHFLILFIKEGNGTLLSSSKKIPLTPGNIFVMFPNESIHYSVNKNSLWTISWIGVYGNFVHDIFKQKGITPDNPIFKISNFGRISNIFEELYTYSFSNKLNNKIYVKSLLYKLFSEFLSDDESKYKTDYVAEAMNIIDFNYDKNITVENIAEKLFINPCYLSRLFKAEKNFSIKQYISEKRIDRAKQILESQDIPINIVASSVGISDPLYFSRFFKKHTGTSPRTYAQTKKKSICQ